MLKKCRSCESSNLKLLKEIKNIPLNIWPQKKIFKNNYKNIEIFICKQCGQMQLQKMNQLQLKKMYTGKTYNFDNKKQIINRINLLKDCYNFKKKTLLDIGGGTNPFLKYLNIGEKYICDFKFQDELKSKKIKLINGDFLKNDFRNKFDYIFMFHALEHLENTNKYLNKIYNILNKNGKLIIEVPNAFHDLNTHPYYIFFHMHITIFCYENLINLLDYNGFKKEKIFNKDDVLFISFRKKILTNQRPLKNYYNYSVNIVHKIFDNINSINNYFANRKYKNIAIFGAGGSSNLLVANSPYLQKNVKYILDNDVLKKNLYLINTKIPIINPSYKILIKLDFIIILNNDHEKLIPKKLRKNIIKITDIINEY